MADIFSGLNDGLRTWKGRMGEESSKMRDYLNGYEIQDTGIGSDYRRRKLNYLTGNKGKWQYVERKTGGRSLTPRQRKERKRRGSSYIIDDSSWF